MKLKFLVLSAFVLFCSLSMQAQKSNTAFRIRAGVNFQNLTGRNANDDKLDNTLKAGFHLGASADIPVAPDYYFQPGVLFSTKGAKNTSNGADTKINISYIEVPLNFLYKPTLGNGKLLVGFGPYVAFAVGGQVTDDGDKNDIKFKSKVTPAEYISDFYLKRFDAGANILFGYEFSNAIFIQLNSQLGLVNINPDIEGVDEKTKIKNTGFGLSLGYRF